MTPIPLGDSALVLSLGADVDEAVLGRVRALAAAIERERLPGVVDVVPAFASVTVFYEIARTGGFAALCGSLAAIASRSAVEGEITAASMRTVEIPVFYGGEAGADLEAVARAAKLSPAEVVRLHSEVDYRVHAIGFTPGFAYLGGLPERLWTPRRATPRPSVPAGAVGIGGKQTGVYPQATPGGWNLIGRTPLRLFDPARAEPALLRTGDWVKFVPLSVTAGETRAESQALDAGGMTRRARGAAAGPAVRVVRPGMLTTLQDTGRRGHRAGGVPLSGAADPFALRLANLLVGNPEDAAALEFALVGPELYFAQATWVALAGAEFGGFPRWQPVCIAAGATLDLGPATRGSRGYLAIAGGLEVDSVLGSRSTYVRAALGGIEGRALRAGDELAVAEGARAARGHWHIDERILPAYSAAPELRVLRGAQADQLGDTLFTASFRVTPQSDRMGVRLHGPTLVRSTTTELVSAAVLPGTVQVPPDGQPIVLMADAQTLGGYPQAAHVISADLPLLAQLRPGDAVRFREVSLDEAHRLALARERALGLLREGLAQKFL